MIQTVKTGLEQLLADSTRLKGQRLGLLCNQASTDRSFRHGRDLINQTLPGQLTSLFTPQHGFFGDKQDNMIESDHTVDQISGLPVYSLYGEVRRPTPEMFSSIDLLLVDLQDVGTRVYTFISTLAYCLEAARESGITVVVLDRPNPIGGLTIEGNLLEKDCRSFVGLYSLPMRHGLTMGEIALIFNEHFGIDAKLEVIPMAGWRREMTFPETGLPWLFPSPNMPSFNTALVYPGQVLWEGTNLSEGRGTCLPFEIFGAPFIDHQDVLNLLPEESSRGCILRPIAFEPTSNKHCSVLCQGFQIQVTDPHLFAPYRLSLNLLQIIRHLYPDHFFYKDPPYEYEYEKLPMDLIIGSQKVRHGLEQGVTVADLEGEWLKDLADFDCLRRKYFLY
ncbi:MAG: DUF1343 domain-containing protein [Proteobacteria bacterium]|nr:DUF1343 domain-containing protein [Pseudomonadota bacterium]MBU1686431.1 DUF1343 domain-containing protein [Pseudomonadota bacterium]